MQLSDHARSLVPVHREITTGVHLRIGTVDFEGALDVAVGLYRDYLDEHPGLLIGLEARDI